MSAWGISNFENDTALDWVAKTVEEKQVSFSKMVDEFMGHFSPEETTLIECSEFLAIAETIAGLIGSPAEDFPEELKEWIESKCIKIEDDLLIKSKKGVELIMTDSEAKEMYLDSGYFVSWEKAQKDLIKRLSE